MVSMTSLSSRQTRNFVSAFTFPEPSKLVQCFLCVISAALFSLPEKEVNMAARHLAFSPNEEND